MGVPNLLKRQVSFPLSVVSALTSFRRLIQKIMKALVLLLLVFVCLFACFLCVCVFYCYCWELSFFPLERGSHKNYWIHILDTSSCFRMTGNGRSRRILRPVYSFHHKSMKETRKKIYQESRITVNTPDLLSKYYSRVRDTISVFD